MSFPVETPSTEILGPVKTGTSVTLRPTRDETDSEAKTFTLYLQ